MDWLDINVLHFQYFFIIMARIGTMVALAPLIGSRAVPSTAKIGLAFMISLVIFSIVVRDFPPIPGNVILFFGLVIREALIGILMGIMGAMLFSAVQLSGQIFGMMVGFGIVNVIDPLSEMQISILGQFEFLLAVLLFFAVGGHHLFIMAMTNSYSILPVNTFTITVGFNEQVVLMLGKLYTMAYKIGFPMIASLFIVKVAMGVIARTVPQMNVFIVGMPLNIFVGLIVMGFSIVYVTFLLKGYFHQFFRDLDLMFQLASGK